MDNYVKNVDKTMLLQIKNLKVKANSKKILKGVNFRIKNKEIVVLLGPNGSGKTVLAQTISGNPHYKIESGEIYFNNKKITKMPPEKRVKLGIVLAWQNPPAIKGISLENFLKKIKKAKELPSSLGNLNILSKELNTNISGGEKKLSELIQVLALNPKFVIFDEIDSGLDLRNLKKVAEIIKKEIIDRKMAVLIITHNGQILNYLKPTKTLVLFDGQIICEHQNYKIVLNTIKKYGYEKCKKCPFFANRPSS